MSQPQITVESHGAKAYGLEWLESQLVRLPQQPHHVSVPAHLSLGVTAPNDTERIDLLIAKAEQFVSDYDCDFAVRSGASKSMPGLMQTKLNVAPEDVPQAIMEIYKSFAEVQAILDTLPPDEQPIGTGCIVQTMVCPTQSQCHCPACKAKRKEQPCSELAYGVVFTADAHGFPNPTLRYTDTSAAVVNGSGLTKYMAAPPIFAWLADYWFEQFGTPPELETVIEFGPESNILAIHLLQIRNQKLTRVEQAALNHRILIPATDATPILTIDGSGIADIGKRSRVVILDTSNPKTVMHTISNKEKPSLILWREGNSFSHAAVLCRSACIAYGHLPPDAKLPKPPYTYFDGRFYKPIIAVKEIEMPNPAIQAIEEANWDILDALVSGEHRLPFADEKAFAKEFLLSLIRYKRFLYHEAPHRVLLEFAQMLAMAAFVACLGELRHEQHHGLAGAFYHSNCRSFVWEYLFAGAYQTPYAWLQYAETDFVKGSFPSNSYGGKKWAAIAHNATELILLLLALRQAPTLKNFSRVDLLVSLMELQAHNGGIYWRKFNMYCADRAILDQFTHASNWKAFVAGLPSALLEDQYYSDQMPFHESINEETNADECGRLIIKPGNLNKRYAIRTPEEFIEEEMLTKSKPSANPSTTPSLAPERSLLDLPEGFAQSDIDVFCVGSSGIPDFFAAQPSGS